MISSGRDDLSGDPCSPADTATRDVGEAPESIGALLRTPCLHSSLSSFHVLLWTWYRGTHFQCVFGLRGLVVLLLRTPRVVRYSPSPLCWNKTHFIPAAARAKPPTNDSVQSHLRNPGPATERSVFSRSAPNLPRDDCPVWVSLARPRGTGPRAGHANRVST